MFFIHSLFLTPICSKERTHYSQYCAAFPGAGSAGSAINTKKIFSDKTAIPIFFPFNFFLFYLNENGFTERRGNYNAQSETRDIRVMKSGKVIL